MGTNVKVGEAEAQDIAPALRPFLQLALEGRTYLIASCGHHYIQYHGSPAPTLYAEIVSDKYLAFTGTPWRADETQAIHALGFVQGTHNVCCNYEPGPWQLDDAAGAAEALFLAIARKDPRAIVELWMRPELPAFGPEIATLTLTEPTPSAPESTPPRERSPPQLIAPASSGWA